MLKILITGGAGYIGNVVSSLFLQMGHKVRAIDALWFDKNVPLAYLTNPSYEFIKGDIRNKEIINTALEGIDFVVHTAAIVGEPACNKFPELTKQVNYEASLNLIESAKQKNIKGIIFFSTCSNYGVSNNIANEDSQLNPLSLYAETKVMVEEYLIKKSDNLNWLICRLSTVYGASLRMRFDLTVNDFTLNAYTKKYLNVFLPYTYRPYIHVFDVANTIVKMIENFPEIKNNIFNVGFEGENYKKIDIVQAIQKHIRDVKIDLTDKGIDTRDYQVDFSKIQKKLGIRKTYSVDDGVREVANLLKLGLIDDPWDPKYYNTSLKSGE